MEKQRQETRPQRGKLRAPALVWYSILILVPHEASNPWGPSSVLTKYISQLECISVSCNQKSTASPSPPCTKLFQQCCSSTKGVLVPLPRLDSGYWDDLLQHFLIPGGLGSVPLTKASLGQQQVGRHKLYWTQAVHTHAEAERMQSCWNGIFMFSFKEVFLGYGVAELNQVLLWKRKLDHLRQSKGKRQRWTHVQLEIKPTVNKRVKGTQWACLY